MFGSVGSIGARLLVMISPGRDFRQTAQMASDGSRFKTKRRGREVFGDHKTAKQIDVRTQKAVEAGKQMQQRRSEACSLPFTGAIFDPHVSSNDTWLCQLEITKTSVGSVCIFAKTMLNYVVFSGSLPNLISDEMFSCMSSLNCWLSR